jgi:hypothetical protein
VAAVVDEAVADEVELEVYVVSNVLSQIIANEPTRLWERLVRL